jgi:DNA/RNA endonuclease YhcR with UshA esterase domain
MKTRGLMLAIFVALLLILTIAPAAAGQNSEQRVAPPKYDPATEATFEGTVQEVRDRECPMSGGMGSHLILKLSDGKTIEVHLATTKFVKTYDLVFKQGDKVSVLGTKVQFEGKETIFARQITRGTETTVFRDKAGKPIW